MADFKILKLKFLSPLHLSKGKTDDYGESEEILHSDTLKSALYVCARQLFEEEVIGNDAQFFESFQVSSAFPFFANELFFPKPMVKLQAFKEGDVAENKQAKKHKKISYLGQSYFEDLINERKLSITTGNITSDGRFVSNTLTSEQMETPIFKSEVQQRVAISSDYIGDPKPYYVDRLYFSDEAGLWFAFQGDNDTYALVIKALKLLGDNGIGTDRNVGNGQFEIMEDTLTLNLPKNPTHQMTLSLWCPEKNELNNSILSESAYGLIKRGGYIASPAKVEHLTFRKKSIYMFSEGSIFPNSQVLKGKIVDLKPDTPVITQNVWRDGLAFMIPINREEL